LFYVPDRKREKFNNIFSKISYILVAIANFFMLILWSIFLLPLAYLKSLLHSAYDNHSRFDIKKIYKVFWVIITRPFLLLFYILEDIFNFWKVLYSEERKIDGEKRSTLVNKEVIYKIRKVLFDYKYRFKKKIISLEELYLRLGLYKKNVKENKSNKSSISNNENQTDNKSNSNPEDNASNSSLGNNYQLNRKNNEENINSNGNSSSDGSSSKYNSMSGENFNKVDNHIAFRYLIDKIVDKDRFIDIERSLVLLPARAKYSQHFLESLKYMNLRFILRGLRNFFFINAVNNPIYSYKKLQHMIYKILIKFKMIFYYIPENTLEKIQQSYTEINNNKIFLKSFENLRRMEEADELSDYDDQDEYANYLNTNNNSGNINGTANSFNSYEIPDKNSQGKKETEMKSSSNSVN
jgi:hypothetical protein